MNHQSDHARKSDSEITTLIRMPLASWKARPFEKFALDEYMKMFNNYNAGAVQDNSGYIRQLEPIVEKRKISRDEVDHRFYKPRKGRHTVETLVRPNKKARTIRRIFS